MLVESSGEKAAEGKARDDAECEGEDGIRPRQEGMHNQFQTRFKYFTKFATEK